MKKNYTNKRVNWEDTVSSQGLTYHSEYWNEGTYYEFTISQILEIERVTEVLSDMCLQGVQHVIDNKLYSKLGIPEFAIQAIEDSWNNDVPSIYGRLDFAYDGVLPPKLLEYNADTPTSLLEAAIIQWYWKEDVFPSSDQFNSLHESLVDKWKQLIPYLKSNVLHVTCSDAEEDLLTTAYLGETARQAGIDVNQILIDDIGWDSFNEQFLDLNDEVIESVFKLYPWEWLLNEEFGKNLISIINNVDFIEPIWKMILSNKGFMAILWELYPNHENLLETSFSSIQKPFVKKPLLSREGEGISIEFVDGVGTSIPSENYGGTYIYQKYFDIPKFDGKTPVLGSWVVDHKPAGLGIREGGLITDNKAMFVPHIIRN